MNLNGVLLIDKPVGLTSHDVVARLRRLLSMKSVGHAGTLDPLASGLLVVLLGEATKLSDYLLNNDKSYEVKVKLGVETDSLDITGQVIRECPVDIAPEKIVAQALSLQGILNLPVPKFSAVKIDGKKLYESAFANKEIELPHRDMEFYNLEIKDQGADFLRLEIHCAKGGYIRAWAHKLGQDLGVGGVVEELRRIGSSPFELQQSVSLEVLQELVRESQSEVELMNQLAGSFIQIEDCLQDWKAVTVTGKDEKLMMNGQVPNEVQRRLIFEQKTAIQLQRIVGIKVISGSTGRLLSILEAIPNKGLKIRRSFNL